MEDESKFIFMYKNTYRGNKTIIKHTCNGETTLPDLMENIIQFLLGAGFHPDNIEEYFKE